MKQEMLEQLNTQRQRLQKRRAAMLENFTSAANAGKSRRLTALVAKIRQTNDFLKALEQIASQTDAAPSGEHRYAVSSLFLHESFKKLTADRDEQFFFITGSEVDGVFVLDHWAEFAHEKRSVVGVTGDTRSTHKLLIKLEQFGQRLLATFHSHPGDGPESTRPSGIDSNFQQRLESAGHVAVMAIFSRDGFIRFFRLDRTIDIEIHGQGVQKHAPGIYRLANLDQA